MRNSAEDQRRIRKNRRDKGQCRFCSMMADVNITVCKRHKEKNQIKGLCRTVKRIKELRCTICGKFLDPDGDRGMKTCINCREHLIISVKQLQLRKRHSAIISD